MASTTGDPVEAVCLASGPSLTDADVQAVRAWRAARPGRLVVVANTTFRAAPWADALFAMDAKWWGVYRDEVMATFTGQCYSTAAVLGVKKLRPAQFLGHRNSGAGAVSLAVHLGARRVLLLGYDCQYAPDGRRHWHGSHPAPLGDAVSIKRWADKFAELAGAVRHKARVINCSRATALECFDRGELHAELLLS